MHRPCGHPSSQHIDSDAAYLVAPNARSRIAGYFHLSDHPNITKHPTLNGAILVECKTLRHVVSSSAKAEVAGIFHNAGMALPIRHILKALNCTTPPSYHLEALQAGLVDKNVWEYVGAMGRGAHPKHKPIG